MNRYDSSAPHAARDRYGTGQTRPPGRGNPEAAGSAAEKANRRLRSTEAAVESVPSARAPSAAAEPSSRFRRLTTVASPQVRPVRLQAPPRRLAGRTDH